MFEAKTPPLLAEKKWEAAATRLSYLCTRTASAKSPKRSVLGVGEPRDVFAPRIRRIYANMTCEDQ